MERVLSLLTLVILNILHGNKTATEIKTAILRDKKGKQHGC